MLSRNLLVAMSCLFVGGRSFEWPHNRIWFLCGPQAVRQCNLWRSEDTLKYFLVLDRAVELDGFGSKSGLCACWPVGLNCIKK